MSGRSDRRAVDCLREQLVGRGFADDGVRLRGMIAWTHPTAGSMAARVEIEPDGRFPFAPPQVRVLDPGCELKPTFHIDRSTDPELPGNLCMWDDDWPVDQAPWTDPDQLLDRIAGWLEQTASGWPDDDACDLERYLERDTDTLVLYNTEDLTSVVGRAVRTEPGPTRAAIVVTSAIRRVKDPRQRRGLYRKDQRLAWVDNLGIVLSPVREWRDIEAVLGERAVTLAQHIALGAVNFLLLRYQRGEQYSVLALKVRRSSNGIELKACESADTSTATRQMRAGPLAPDLANAKIGIVGCGAIGSFAADMLFRSGVRQLTLLDHERLRPGNVVRHLAGNGHLGHWKVHAVRNCLANIDTDVDAIRTRPEALTTLNDALDLVVSHHVVLDATGNARASSLLATAAGIVGPGSGHAVVSACVQREGQIGRVDRLPPRGGETYLPALPAVEDADRPREQGCGSPVSRTPPGAVIASAELACRVVIDEATGECNLPASLVDVRCVQSQPPYNHAGLLTSQPSGDEKRRREATAS